EQAYVEDLENSTEIVLDLRRPRPRLARPRMPRGVPRPSLRRGAAAHRPLGRRGSAGRAAAGAMRIGHTTGAAFTDRRVLGPVEARLMTAGGIALTALAVLFAVCPRALAYPAAFFAAWGGLALLYRGYRLWRKPRPPRE